MKKGFILVLSVLFALTVNAQSYTNFESDVRFDKDGSSTVAVSHYGEYAISKNFGVVDYIAVNNETTAASTYGEALIGLYVRPIKNVTVGALLL